MSVRTDVINLNVNINGDVARNSLNELKKTATDLTRKAEDAKKVQTLLRSEFRLTEKAYTAALKEGGYFSEKTKAAAEQMRISFEKLTTATNGYNKIKTDLDGVTDKLGLVRKQIGLTSLSLKELESERRKLMAIKGSLIPFSAEDKQIEKQLTAVNKRIYDVKNGVTGLASVFSRFKDELKQLGTFAVGYLGFQFITSQFSSIIKGSGKLADQLADLRRVAGLTAEEADNLSKSLKNIDTRTANGGLRDIAIIAGKLGVAKNDILDFTKAVDMLVVSLGDELGDADQLTTQLGKILNVFDGKITGDNITRLGNSFVELANTGAATGGFIAEFDQRLSGVAKSAGIGLGALSGLGAGIEEMGGRVESSTTAIQKLIISIASDIPAAAKIAGQSTEEFDKLFKFDPTEALLKYAEGLVKNKESFAAVTASLKDAGEEGARTIETISKLGTGADKLRERIDLGKKSIQENGAITEAFALKNENLGAEIDKLGKEFNKLMTSNAVVNFLKDAVIGAREFIKWLKDLPTFIQENRIAISTLVTAFLVMNKQIILSNALWLANKAAVVAGTIAQYAAAAATLVYRVALLSLAAVQALVTGNITRARAAWELLNKAFKASPIGLIVAGVVALGIALDNAFSKVSRLQKMTEEFNKRAIEQYGDQVNKIEQLKKALESENIGYEQKKKLYQELIAINPEFAKTLELDAQGHLHGAEAINEFIKSLKRKGEIEAAQSLSNEKNKEVLEAQSEIDILKPKILSGDYTAADLIKAGRADARLKEAQKAKDYFDEKLSKIYASGSTVGTMEFFQPADTGATGTKTTDATVAARKLFLENKIKDLEESYQKLNATDRKGQQANLAQQKKYQAELDALMGKEEKKSSAEKKAETEYDRLKKEAAEFYKDLQKLKEQAAIASGTEDEKELLALQQKYNELHAKALEYYKKNVISRGKYTEEEKLIVEAFNSDLAALQKKQFDKYSGEEYDRALNDTKEYFDQQRNLEGQRYAQGLSTKSQYDAELKSLDLQEKGQLVTVAQDYSGNVKKADADLFNFKKDLQKSATENDIEQSELRKKTAKEEAIAKVKLQILAAPLGSKERIEAEKRLKKLEFEQDTEALDKKSDLYKQKAAELQAALDQIDADAKQRRLAAWDEFAQNVLSITSTLFNALDNLDQRQFRRDKALNDAKKNNYKNLLDTKLLSQKQYDKKVAEADAELAKKKHDLDMKAFKRQQALAITAALINGAIAVTSTLAARPGLADIFSLGVARAVQVGLVVAATAAQVAAIATQEPPQAAKGKWFREGDKHSDPSGGIPVLIERDEAVMKADTMTDNKQYTVTGTPAQITSKLNSMHGGVSWATGATIQQPKFRERPPQMNPNLPRIMAEGGLGFARQMNQSTVNGNDGLLRELILKQDELITEVKNQKQQLHAVVSIKEYRETEKKYDNAKKASGMSQ